MDLINFLGEWNIIYFMEKIKKIKLKTHNGHLIHYLLSHRLIQVKVERKHQTNIVLT